MLGNVFSPYWARARRGGGVASGLDFSTFNVALQTRGRAHWALTERSSTSVVRSADHLSIGRSHLEQRGDDVIATIDERSAPWGTPVRGTVRLVPASRSDSRFELDPHGLHAWSPLVPSARIEVDFTEPRLRFCGTGYLDKNEGAGPLEDTFASWSWSRLSDGRDASISYDVSLRDGSERLLSLRTRQGQLEQGEVTPSALLPSTRFGLARSVRSEAAHVDPPRLVRTLEDGPFYARSMVEAKVGGRPAFGIHEAVSLDRFRASWVQWLLPFRMRVEAT